MKKFKSQSENIHLHKRYSQLKETFIIISKAQMTIKERKID